MKFMCILHIQKNKDGIVSFEIVIIICSIDYKVVFRGALKRQVNTYLDSWPFITLREGILALKKN